MAMNRKIHWLAPGSMLGGLLAGIVFALAHHLFYNSLEGKAALGGRDYRFLGTDVSQQQTNIAIGTAFAFLSKASLVWAASVAYVQLFWRNLVSQKRAAPTLGRLDSIAHATDNFLILLNVKLWWSYSFMLLLATTAWYCMQLLTDDLH